VDSRMKVLATRVIEVMDKADQEIPEPSTDFVDWKVVAVELWDMLSHVMDLNDPEQHAPQGDNDFQDACYRLAMLELQEEIK
jgi:hypothetical protein